VLLLQIAAVLLIRLVRIFDEVAHILLRTSRNSTLHISYRAVSCLNLGCERFIFGRGMFDQVPSGEHA
jgi:hypothetical protein